MRIFLNILPVICCSLLMAAHLGRANMTILQIISLLAPLLLLWKHKAAARFIQLILIIFGFEWIRTMIHYVQIRMELGEDWVRLAIILSVVALLNFSSLLVFRNKKMKEVYHLNK